MSQLRVLLAFLLPIGPLSCAAPEQFGAGGPLAHAIQPSFDWLLKETSHEAELVQREQGLLLDNGLARRTWRLDRNGACVALDDLGRNASVLRAVRPEARLVIDGETWDIGGLDGQPNHAYLRTEWLDEMSVPEKAFRFRGWERVAIEERIVWPRVRHSAPGAVWPPAGEAVRLDFVPPDGVGLDGLVVSVHYELYDGIPLFAKQVRVHNGTGRIVEIDRLTAEVLAVVESESRVETRAGAHYGSPTSLEVVTDYSFGGGVLENAQAQVVHWRTDPAYTTQVNYLLQTPCLLEVEPLRGPDVLLQDGEDFRGFWVFELLYDSDERERRSLALRAIYRTIAPWVTENPLQLHVVSSDPVVVKRAIDQAAECGFEMVSLSFGSGLDMEDESEENLNKYREFADYAKARGIELGGYSLLASRRIQPESDNAVNPETGDSSGQTFGYAPALASHWGQEYFRKLRKFFDATGFSQFTHDGNYPGDWDDAARPPLQRGLDDSQWVQWRIITEFYGWLLARGAYLRVPDSYYLNGSHQQGMGYREVNWSLPRAQQVIHTRQNIFDGTWNRTSSMGWMFVPLTQYHGGGAAATIEPLDDHLDHYERMLSSNLALGVQPAYRGHRLYDTERVRDRVRAWVDWYKEHRDILESDLIHGRRADGRDLDWMLHVNPKLETRGMLVVFNPLEHDVERQLRVPLYYTGLRGRAQVSANGEAKRWFSLDGRSELSLHVRVPAGGMSWYAIR